MPHILARPDDAGGLVPFAPECRLRPVVHAVIHAFAWSLDESLGLIRRLVEIDRRIAIIERRSSHG
jgi:hypothetical protein